MKSFNHWCAQCDSDKSYSYCKSSESGSKNFVVWSSLFASIYFSPIFGLTSLLFFFQIEMFFHVNIFFIWIFFLCPKCSEDDETWIRGRKSENRTAIEQWFDMVNVGNYNEKYQSYLCYLEHGSWPVNFNTTYTRAHRSHSMHGRIWDWPCLWQNDIISRNQRMWIPTDSKMSQNYMSCARHCVQYCELAS